MDQIPFARLFKGNLFGSTFASYSVADPGEGPGGPPPPPPPHCVFVPFSTFPLFGVNRNGHKLFNPDFASDTERNSMQCNLSRRSKQSFSLGSLHFPSNIKAWAGFDRQHNFVVPVSM